MKKRIAWKSCFLFASIAMVIMVKGFSGKASGISESAALMKSGMIIRN